MRRVWWRPPPAALLSRVAIAETLAGVLHGHLVIGRPHVHLAGVGIALVSRFSFAGHLPLLAVHLPRDRVPFDFDVAELARRILTAARNGVLGILGFFFRDALGERARRHLHAGHVHLRRDFPFAGLHGIFRSIGGKRRDS